MTNDKKIKIQITSHGMLNCFGYRGIRTPAQVELYEHQLAVLEQMGVFFKKIPDVVSTIPVRKNQDTLVVKKVEDKTENK